MIHDLILNNISAKVTLGAKPFTRAVQYWQNGNLFSYFNNDVYVQGRAMAIEVPYALAIVPEPTGAKLLQELVDTEGNITAIPHQVIPKGSYELEGEIAPGYTWLEYFYDSQATAGAKRGYEFFFNCQNGMIARIVKELFPEVAHVPNVELMPYDAAGVFHQLLIVEFDERGITPLLGAMPFTYSLNGGAFVPLEEVPENPEGELVVRDALGNEKTLTYTAPEE